MNRTFCANSCMSLCAALLLVLPAGCGGGGGQTTGNDKGFLGDMVGSTLSAFGVDSRASQAASAGVTMGVKAWELDQLTPENEYYIGRAVAANLVARHGIYNDPVAARYVSMVGHTCAAASDMPETYGGYRFIILDTDEVNAFGAPGGYVLVTKGMLKTCHSEDALAAVVSHEIGHVQNRDGLNAIKSSQMWKTGLHEGAKLAAQGDIAAATSLFDTLIDGFVEQVIDKGYSRDAEAKADAAGVKIMTAAGYDASSMIDMLHAMEAHWTPGAGMAKTHPSPTQRIDKVKSKISSNPASPSSARQARFDAAMSSLLSR